LRGDDEVVLAGDVAARLPQELVVDVADQARRDLGEELPKLRRGLSERGPARDGVGQEARPGGLQRPPDLLGWESWWKSVMIWSRSLSSIVKPSLVASFLKAVKMPVSQSMSVP